MYIFMAGLNLEFWIVPRAASSVQNSSLVAFAWALIWSGNNDRSFLSAKKAKYYLK